MDNIFIDGILNGRVAFVTGGGTGITGGVARALAEAGASVALVSRKLENLEPAAKAINDAHADFETVKPAVSEWIGKQPAYLQAALKATWEGGAAKDVVDLVTRFKQDTGRAAAPKKDEPKPAKKTPTAKA